MADVQRLDLDILEPKDEAEVTLGGKTYKVKPASVRTIVGLTRIAKKMETLANLASDPGATDEQKDKAANEGQAALEELQSLLGPIIPGLDDGSVHLNIVQAGALMRFVIQISQPLDSVALKEAGIDYDAGDVKKNQFVS